MKPILLSILILSSISIFSQSTNKEVHNYRTTQPERLSPKYLTVRQFMKIFTENYNPKSKLNFRVLYGEFPENWVKNSDVQYLLSIVDSKKKCCGYMNTLSSAISSDNAEVGGFALIFLKSYKNKTKIDLGLNSNPKTNLKEAAQIKLWFSKI